jgi:hypothetical protein
MKKCALAVLITVLWSASAFCQTLDKTKDLIKLKDRQWMIEAYSSRDLKDFDRIVADDFLIMAGNGKVLTKAEKRANVKRDYTDPATMAQPNYIFRIDANSHNVRVFDKSVISIGYIVEDYVWQGTPIKNRVYFTNVYLKRGRGWQVVASQFTNVKQ